MLKDKSKREMRYKITCSKCGWFHVEERKESFKDLKECINCGNEYNHSRDIKVIEENNEKR